MRTLIRTQIATALVLTQLFSAGYASATRSAPGKKPVAAKKAVAATKPSSGQNGAQDNAVLALRAALDQSRTPKERREVVKVTLTFVLGDFLFVGHDRRLELRDGRGHFVVRDHAARTQLLAHDPDEILSQIFEHNHVRRGATLECNQHDGPVSFVLFTSA